MMYFYLILDKPYKRNKILKNKYGMTKSIGRRAVVSKATQTWPDGVIPYDMSNMNRKYKI